MARLGYLQRIAYGRSSHEHPSRNDVSVRAEGSSSGAQRGEETQGADDARQRGDNGGSSAVPLVTEYVQQYNERGHPFNPKSRLYGRRMRSAANDVLSVLGIVEKSEGGEARSEEREQITRPTSEAEEMTGRAILAGSLVLIPVATWWIGASTNRLMVFPPLPGRSLIEILTAQARALGPMPFLFAGLPSVMVAAVLSPKAWKKPVVYHVDRLVMATISTRNARLFYGNRVRPLLSGLVEFGLQAIAFPFRLHAVLQSLGFIPFSKSTILPRWSALIPFVHDHALIVGATPPPMVVLFIYYSLDIVLQKRLTHFLITRGFGIRDEDDMEARHEESSNKQMVPSSTFRPYDVVERLRTAWGQTVACLGLSATWHGSHRPRAAQSPQPDGNQENIPPQSSEQNRFGQRSQASQPVSVAVTAPATHTAGDVAADSNAADHASGEIISIDFNDPQNLVDPESPAAPNATIRLSTYDAYSGVYDLEIGVPEDVSASPPVRASDHVTTPENDNSETARGMASERRRQAVYSQISDLATAVPTLFGVVLENALGSLMVAPIKFMVLRAISTHYVNNGHAILPGYLAGLSMIPAPWRGLGVRGLGGWAAAGSYGQKILLCYAIDLVVCLTLIRAEWAVVRRVGNRWFNWRTDPRSRSESK